MASAADTASCTTARIITAVAFTFWTQVKAETAPSGAVNISQQNIAGNSPTMNYQNLGGIKMNIFTRIFKVRSKVTVYFDKNGEPIEATGNIGETRANRAAGWLRLKDVEPTAGMKFRAGLINCFRFFRRATGQSRRSRRRRYNQRHGGESRSSRRRVLKLGGSRG